MPTPSARDADIERDAAVLRRRHRHFAAVAFGRGPLAETAPSSAFCRGVEDSFVEHAPHPVLRHRQRRALNFALLLSLVGRSGSPRRAGRLKIGRFGHRLATSAPAARPTPKHLFIGPSRIDTVGERDVGGHTPAQADPRASHLNPYSMTVVTATEAGAAQRRLFGQLLRDPGQEPLPLQASGCARL